MSTEITASKRAVPTYKFIADVGFRTAKIFPEDALRSALHYKPHPDDVFIATYPKCGTTWMQAILFNIFNKGQPWTFGLDVFQRAPFLEMMGAEAVDKAKRPIAIKTHLPYELTPYSPHAKYIFTARNPKDCCVSFYYHTKQGYFYEFEEATFDDFFELFIDGEVEFGDYFNTVLSWYKHKDDDNVLFQTYESLKADTKGGILKIAEFLGPEYKKELEEDPSLVQNILHYSSTDYMKESINKAFDEMSKLPKEYLMNQPDIPDVMKTVFLGIGESGKSASAVRKGIVGDWRNHFSKEQNARLDKKFKERTKGTDIAKLWEDYM